jgi:amino acid transporter
LDDEEQQLNQEWEELLNELRVILPGTQVIFAFLLSIPFTSRFEQITGADKLVYFIAFLAAAGAAVILIAPGAQHRLLWRRQKKDYELRLATRLAVVGTTLLAVAMASVVYLIADVVYGGTLPAAATAVLATGTVWLWYVWPLLIRRRPAREQDRTVSPDRGRRDAVTALASRRRRSHSDSL